MLDWSAHQLRNRSKINRMMLIQWIADAHQSRCIEPHEWFRIKFDKFHNKVGVKKYCEWSEVQVKCNLSKTIKWDDTSCINFIAINFPNKQSVRHSESEFQIESNDFFALLCIDFIIDAWWWCGNRNKREKLNLSCVNFVSANVFILKRRSIFLTFVERNAVHFQLIGICVWCLYFHT